MMYTLSYEITGACLYILFIIIFNLFYGHHSKKDIIFEILLISGLIACVADTVLLLMVARAFGVLTLIIGCVYVYIAVRSKRNKWIIIAKNLVIIIIPLFAYVVNIMFPYTLTIGFGNALGTMILLFTIETPDFAKLVETQKELEDSNKKEIEAKNEADRASLAKSRFLANMTHEIRTPINAILGLDEIMLRETNSSLVLGYALKMRNAGNALLAIVNDILDFSKIEFGKMQLIYSRYDFSELIENVVSRTEPMLFEKGIEFKLDIDERLPKNLIGDDVRIKQVLQNILNNAVAYTQKGSVTLKISGSTLEDELDHLKIRFEINDTGVGIKEEDISKLFDNFERIDTNQGSKPDGIGLGLSIATLLLKLMHSKLEVKSEYGVGSSFAFEVNQMITDQEKLGDITKKLSKKSLEYEYHESFKAPKANILVVDDTDLNLFVIRKLLEKTEIKVDTASDGYNCIEMVNNKKYDIIFMDHMMPGMDGIETATKVWGLKDRSDIPIVALTASTSSDDIDLFLKSGFSGFLTKPIEQDKLEDTIKKLIPDKLA